MEVELAAVSQDERAHRRHRLGRREDVRDRVALPSRGVSLVDVTAPDVDDGFAVEVHRDGRADVEACVQLLGKDRWHLRESLVVVAVDLGHFSLLSFRAEYEARLH